MASKQDKRIAIINHDLCKPKKCGQGQHGKQPCKLICPVNKIGKVCIDVDSSAPFAKINEDSCIGCGQCVKICPFKAINIVKLPVMLDNMLLHSYGENSFRLYKVPIPKQGHINGIIGQNGIGKSTLLQILNNSIKPNLGLTNDNIKNILNFAKGTELHKYLSLLYSKKGLISVQKYQNIYQNIKHTLVKDFIQYNMANVFHQQVFNDLGLHSLLNCYLDNLSGGELQRVCCASTLLYDANIYIFDEFTNYLDIDQRLIVANLIKALKRHDRYIFVVDHDLSILDYLSDNIIILYGTPGAFGIVSQVMATNNAINTYFNGYIQSENIKFRDSAYSFYSSNSVEIKMESFNNYSFAYKSKTIIYDNFQLNINQAALDSESLYIIVGRNGTGKSTFLNYLDDELKDHIISYKPQHTEICDTDRNKTVINYLYDNIKISMSKQHFQTDVVKQLHIDALYDMKMSNLSGGELQRVLICKCLGTLL